MELTLAGNIAGWMTHNELKWLAKQAQKHEKIVEIGSYMGRSTRAIGDNTKGFVIAVDDFKGPRDASVPQVFRDSLFEIFVYNLGDLLQTGKVIAIASNQHDVIIDFSPDMVFLDGSHTYEDVKKDIELWLPRIIKGGLICGHDYTNMASVRDATKETIGKVKVAKGTSIWYAKV